MIKITYPRGEYMTKKSIYTILLVMILARLFSLSWLPIMDPSEGRYATIGKIMSTSGNYITPQIVRRGDIIPFWGKPPLFFWSEAFTIKLFGANDFSPRLPSAISGILLLLMVYWIIGRYHGRESGAAAAFITFSSGAFFFMSGLVLLDMMLVLFSSGAWLFYYAFMQESGKKKKKLFSIAVFISLALGFMVKGPVALVMFGLPVFLWTLLNKRWKHLLDHAWFSGGGLFLLITVPWFVVAEKATPGFLKYFFINENILRFVSDKYGDKYGSGHEFPHGMSILFMLAATAPWVALALFMVIRKFIRLKKLNTGDSWVKTLGKSLNNDDRRSNDKYDYFVITFVSITVFWCFARQILLYYLLPVVPAFSIWAAFYFKGNNFSLKSIARSALCLICLYAIALSVMYLALSDSGSTKRIIGYIKNMNDVDNIVFVRRVPNSASYYGGDMIALHGKEEIETSLKRGEGKPNTVYVISRYYRKRFYDVIKSSNSNIAIIYKSPEWVIAKEEKSKLISGTGR